LGASLRQPELFFSPGWQSVGEGFSGSFMVNRNLIRSLEDDSMSAQLDLLLPEDEMEGIVLDGLEDLNQSFDVNQIVMGRIVEVNGEYVVIDVGFKSEGAININEWDETEEPPQVGQQVKVLIEEMEDALGPANDIHGMISLSKRKAEDPGLGTDDERSCRGPSGHRYSNTQNQRWSAGRYRRERILAS
jgi:transcriptional accessory protein Tex/SPT6